MRGRELACLPTSTPRHRPFLCTCVGRHSGSSSSVIWQTFPEPLLSAGPFVGYWESRLDRAIFALKSPSLVAEASLKEE